MKHIHFIIFNNRCNRLSAYLIIKVFFSALMAAENRTRMQTDICLIGQPLASLVRSKLPSNGEILGRLFHLLRQEKRTLHDAVTVVDSEMMIFWNQARIPVTQSQHRIQRLKSLYEEWRRLGKSKSRITPAEEKRRTDFTNMLENLFDVAHVDSMKMLKNNDDKAFLIAQRKEGRHGIMQGIDQKLTKAETSRQRRNEASRIRREREAERQATVYASVTCDDYKEEEEDTDSAGHELYLPAPKSTPEGQRSKIHVPTITPQLSLALDRTKTTDRNAVHILSASATALGHDPSTIPLSRQTIRRARQKARREAVLTLQESFRPNVPLTVHWDGKLVADEPGNERFERLPILVSGLGVEKLLAVPKISSGTGEAMAEAILTVLQEWDLIDHVTGMAFDTTASNTGNYNGACMRLQQKMEKDLLHFACRKHIRNCH